MANMYHFEIELIFQVGVGVGEGVGEGVGDGGVKDS
jgi:hypothetical protein